VDRDAGIDLGEPVPGIDAAASVSTVPLVGDWRQAVYLVGQSADVRRHQSRFNRVSSGYFKTLEIPLVAGRDFDEHDRPATPRAVIANESFAVELLNGASPLGVTFQLDGPNGRPDALYQIVGVVQNTKYESLREPFQPIVYLAVSQVASPGPFDQILVRSTLPGSRLMSAVKRAIEETNPAIAFHFHDFQEQLRYSILQERLMAALCGFFALLAAVLATIGVYGIISYSVAQRTNEIGIRLALGADRRAIRRLILGEAATLVGVGLAAGAALASISTKAASALLFGLQPNDPPTLFAAIALLASVAAAASYLPARRASTVDPMVALRCE
jgi:predicted permease